MLSGHQIQLEVGLGGICIEPFCPEQLNPNSYNVRLGDRLLYLDETELDLHELPRMVELAIPPEGFLLKKGEVYLGATIETIGSEYYVPVIDGRSTTGRYGLSVHITAGFGDVGFKGTFTLEIEARHRDTWIRTGDMIAQVSFHELTGRVEKYSGSYQGQTGPRGPKPLR